MNNEIKEESGEIIEAPNELAAVAIREGVEADQQSLLLASFAPYHAAIQKTMQTSKGVTDGADPLQRKLARECRLELWRTANALENTRKERKAGALRYGKAVDGMANVLKFICEPEEERLAGIEQFEARREAARIAALVEERSKELEAVGAVPAMYNLAAMNDETWGIVIAAAKKAQADKIEADRKAEADRIERERKEAEERARIKAENERLKAEADKREKEIEAERKKAQAEKEAAYNRAEQERKKIEAEKAEAEKKANAAIEAEREKARAAAKKSEDERAKLPKAANDERLAREAVERKAAQERADAEAEKRKAEESELAAKKKAEKAPDKEKLLSFVSTLNEIGLPRVKTTEGAAVVSGIEKMIAKMTAWINAEVEKL